MDIKLRLIAALAVAAAAPAVFTGCGGGAECGEGTTEQDGQCIAEVDDPTTCGGGTTLMDGECVLDEEVVCTGDSMLEDGECVADPDEAEACGEGTEYDMGAGECVPTSTIECGDDTVEQDGECVPDTDALCQAGTTANDDGQCVVDETTLCDGNTILDPMTNTCVVNDTGVYCGDNTAFDTDAGTCLPTEEVCDNGTVFSEDTGLCLPEATCRMGDVILDGQCVAPIQEALANADVTSNEEADPAANNDDPTTGGTPAELTIPSMDTALSVAGVIGEATDLDGDGALDQDLDYYTFTATAGQLFDVSVQPAGGGSLSFMLMDADGDYQRFSTFGFSSGAQRSFLIPTDGTYTLVVGPALTLASEGLIGPAGGEAWDYLLQIQESTAPTPTDVDTSAANLTGSFANLSDNLFRATNLSSGDYVVFSADTIGEDVEGVVQLWSSPTELFATYDIEQGDELAIALPFDEPLIFFDWETALGDDLGFEVSAQAPTNQENLGLIAAGTSQDATAFDLAGGGFHYLTFEIAPGEVLEISHNNDEDEEIDYDLFDIDTGEEVDSSSFVDDLDDSGRDINYEYLRDGGRFLLTIENNSSSSALTNEVVTIGSITPQVPANPLSTTESVSSTRSMLLGDERRTFYLLEVNEWVDAQFTLDTNGGGGDPDLRVYDEFSLETLFTETGSGDKDTTETVAPGLYLVSIEANSELDMGYNFAAVGAAPTGDIEVEPNDAKAEATALALDTEWTGASSGDMDTDLYQITLAADLGANEALQIAVDGGGDEDSPDYGCRLLSDAAMNDEIAAASPRREGCLLWAGDLSAGDYYIEITTTTPGTYYYDIEATIVPGVSLEVEPNDDTMTATPIPVTDVLDDGVLLGGTLATVQDVDFWELTLPAALSADETLSLEATLEGNNISDDGMWALLDAMGAPIGMSVSLGEALRAQGLAAGTYYVMFMRTGDPAEEINYLISAKVSLEVLDTEPNDDAMNAQTASEDATIVGTAGNIQGTEPDWYLINLSGGDYTFELTGDYFCSGLYLYDSSQALIEDGSNFSDDTSITATGLAAGDYYLVVDGSCGSTTGTFNYSVTTTKN